MHLYKSCLCHRNQQNIKSKILLEQFFFIDQDTYWAQPNGCLNSDMFYLDKLLLVEKGNIVPSGPVDVQWTSIERPYRTTGRPKGTFNGRLVDVPNETQLVHPNRTKMDVHFRPSRDDGHGT